MFIPIVSIYYNNRKCFIHFRLSEQYFMVPPATALWSLFLYKGGQMFFNSIIFFDFLEIMWDC